MNSINPWHRTWKRRKPFEVGAVFIVRARCKWLHPRATCRVPYPKSKIIAKHSVFSLSVFYPIRQFICLFVARAGAELQEVAMMIRQHRPVGKNKRSTKHAPYDAPTDRYWPDESNFKVRGELLPCFSEIPRNRMDIYISVFTRK